MQFRTVVKSEQKLIPEQEKFQQTQNREEAGEPRMTPDLCGKTFTQKQTGVFYCFDPKKRKRDQ